MKTMLIVDDELAIARMIQKVADGCGYSATLTTRSDEFMDQVAAIDPTVIVMDLSIPSADGVELIRFLATAKCKAKILIISGSDPRVLETTGALGSALGLSIVGMINKPVRLAALRAAIEEL